MPDNGRQPAHYDQRRVGLLAALYSHRGDLKKIGPLLVESPTSREPSGAPIINLPPDADQAVGLYCFKQQEYNRAESYFRERLAFLIKNKPDDWTRFATESVLGRCLVAAKKFAEAERLLLSAYDGMTPRAKGRPPADQAAPANSNRSDSKALRVVGQEGGSREVAK